MIKQILRTASIIIIGLFLLNGKDDSYSIDAKVIEKSVAKISDNLYAGKFEVSNAMYNQFLNFLRHVNGTEDLKTCLIDSLGWIADKQNYNEPLVMYYHKHPFYYEHPVVNISYEAANLFCSWLTDMYNAFPKRKFGKVKFRLPTEQEWMLAAHAGHPDYKFANGDTVRAAKNGSMMYNFNSVKYFTFKNKSDSALMNENAGMLAPCKSYWANDFGLYNMSGNAAEMISTKGVAKGGSFLDGESSLRIDNYISYDKSACNIGFRYLMEVVKMENGNDYDLKKQ
jgi:formylglycine-generating enzyme required for sulfatase activity